MHEVRREVRQIRYRRLRHTDNIQPRGVNMDVRVNQAGHQETAAAINHLSAVPDRDARTPRGSRSLRRRRSHRRAVFPIRRRKRGRIERQFSWPLGSRSYYMFVAVSRKRAEGGRIFSRDHTLVPRRGLRKSARFYGRSSSSATSASAASNSSRVNSNKPQSGQITSIWLFPSSTKRPIASARQRGHAISRGPSSSKIAMPRKGARRGPRGNGKPCAIRAMSRIKGRHDGNF